MGSLSERDHLKDIGVYGKIMFQWFLKWDVCIDCIHISQDMDKWRDAVECGNELSGSIKCRGIFLST